VIAITAGGALLRHPVSHDAGDSSPANQGRLIMMTAITFALLALAIATPGIITLVMSDRTDVA
jgi:hypothetical protein